MIRMCSMVCLCLSVVDRRCVENHHEASSPSEKLRTQFKLSKINFRNILLLSTFLLITVVTCRAKLTKECLVDYLKFRGVNDEAFDSIEAYSGDPGACSDEVKNKVKQIYETTRSRMESHIKQQPHADCAMKKVENESFENLLLKAEAIDLKGVGLKFWKISSKRSKVAELEDKAQEIVNNALIECKGNEILLSENFFL